MSRLKDIVDLVQAQYPTTNAPTFELGARFDSANRGWNRIVVWTESSTIEPPSMATHERGQEAIAVRRVRVVWSLWARDYPQAESRLHALILAIANALGDSSISVDFEGEAWQGEDGRVTGGGSLVHLSTVIGLHVLASDFGVVQSDIEPGTPLPLTELDGVGITLTQGDTTLPPLEIGDIPEPPDPDPDPDEDP